MFCTRCDGMGYLNLTVDFKFYKRLLEALDEVDSESEQEILADWREIEDHDVQVCDCCGDGECWYGVPGEHYNDLDPQGSRGPYTYNGGFCGCH